VQVVDRNEQGYICTHCLFQNLPGFGAGRQGIELQVAASDKRDGILGIKLNDGDEFKSSGNNCRVKNMNHSDKVSFSTEMARQFVKQPFDQVGNHDSPANN
jgi:hypothetical protein